MFSKKLKELRLKANLTQKEIAEKLNISQPSYQQWESGRRNLSARRAAVVRGRRARSGCGTPGPWP